jgi:hypothetical protein
MASRAAPPPRWPLHDDEDRALQVLEKALGDDLRRHFGGVVLPPAAEMAWREDNRRVSNGEQYLIAVNAALAHPVSRQWKGYWQR